MDYQCLSASEDIEAFSEKKALVGGNLVFFSINREQTPPQGYVEQQSLNIQRTFTSRLRKKTDKLHVWLHPTLLTLKGKCKIALTIEVYLKWGLKREGLHALIGGVEDKSKNFLVDVLIFNKNKLVAIYDRELPGRESKRFESAAQSVCEEITRSYPGIDINISSPLSDWGQNNCDYIDGAPLTNLPFKNLITLNSQKKDFIVPGLISFAGVCLFGGFTWHGWQAYSDALHQYEITKQNPVILQQGGVDSYYINVMTQRRLMMEEVRKQDKFSSDIRQVLDGIRGIQDVHVVEVRVPGKALADQHSGSSEKQTEPDVSLSISTPKKNQSSVDQLKEIITNISSNSRYTIRSANPAWKDENDQRIFFLEGDLNGK